MLTFLHLSDLHFTTEDAGTQFDRDAKIREALLEDLGVDGRTKFAGIFVTGDIAYNGRADEFERARGWLEQVRAKTESPPEAIFAVPGNHDVDRKVVSRESSLWELHQSIRKQSDSEQRLNSLNKKLHDPFDFLAAMQDYRGFAAVYECPTTPRDLAWCHVLDDDQTLEDGTSVRVHGLNTALISDEEDAKANLLLSASQFHRFSSDPGYVNIVLCHHPHSWLLDGNQANDFFRNQANVVLCGHEHDVRCYNEGGSLRVFAGAVHPNPREPHWEPCYHVLRLSISTERGRELIATVEARVWRDKDKCFVPYAHRGGALRYEDRQRLPDWAPRAKDASRSAAVENMPTVTASGGAMASSLPVDAHLAAARRKLIVHFFRLGTISRYRAVIDAGTWEESDDELQGQARWARVFERAERSGRLAALWDAVAAEDESLAAQSNPFVDPRNAP